MGSATAAAKPAATHASTALPPAPRTSTAAAVVAGWPDATATGAAALTARSARRGASSPARSVMSWSKYGTAATTSGAGAQLGADLGLPLGHHLEVEEALAHLAQHAG